MTHAGFNNSARLPRWLLWALAGLVCGTALGGVVWAAGQLLALRDVPQPAADRFFADRLPDAFGVAQQPPPDVDNLWCFHEEVHLPQGIDTIRRWGLLAERDGQLFRQHIYEDFASRGFDDGAEQDFKIAAARVDCQLHLTRSRQNYLRLGGAGVALLGMIALGGLGFWQLARNRTGGPLALALVVASAAGVYWQVEILWAIWPGLAALVALGILALAGRVTRP